MAVRLSRQQRSYLIDLLELLRADLRIYPPVFFSEFEGVDAKDEFTAEFLGRGVCEPGQRMFHYSGESPPHTVFLFGPDNVKDGIDRLMVIGPRLLDAIAFFSTPEAASQIEQLKNQGDMRQALLAGRFVLLAAERVREFEPESLSLPNIVKGKLSCDTNEGQPGPIYFPGGKFSPMDHHHYGEWFALRTIAANGTVSVAILTTPIIQAAAIVVNYALRSTPSAPESRRKIKTRANKAILLFHSAHDEQQGVWLDRPLSLSHIAKIMNMDERTARSFFSPTGLIQKTRENWIVKLDTINPQTADRLRSASRAKN